MAHESITCQEALDQGWEEMDEVEREALVNSEQRIKTKSFRKLPPDNRPPVKAIEGWYELAPFHLRFKFDEYLADVPETINDSKPPIPGARAIIAPHAGYFYSGRCSAWAFRCLDLTNVKRVFVLGPTHKYAFSGLATSTFSRYHTPLGSFAVDQPILNEITEAAIGKVQVADIPRAKELDEHSLEMEIAFLYKRCEEEFKTEDNFPVIAPMLVSGSGRDEKAIGKILAPYLEDKQNAFVISSDFCHWGWFFDYTPYWPQNDPKRIVHLNKWDDHPTDPPIHETIRLLDKQAMDALETGVHDNFLSDIRKTGNTVCGRHPIGAMMAALELYSADRPEKDIVKFKVVRYNRSALLTNPDKSSVSYVSAYAVL